MVSTRSSIWRDMPVFLSGHTGFKGSWLSVMLHQLGAQVHGYALAPPTEPNLYSQAGIKAMLATDSRADLADLAALKAAMTAAQPQVVFHLAAQPLVRESYADPLNTLATNVMGTAHVLEAVRALPCVRAVVVIATDKVYENREWLYPYRETDPLGGHDPYSASKAAAEIVTASYRASFFDCPGGHAARIASARAGNVIGGGDWATDRLVPDCLREFAAGRAVHLRYPGAIRPWQHVLEPLHGYLQLAESLLSQEGARFTGPWNFGPALADNASVGTLARLIASDWGETATLTHDESTSNPHEAGILRLDTSRAAIELGWKPRWNLATAVKKTVAWHRAWCAGSEAATLVRTQLTDYLNNDI